MKRVSNRTTFRIRLIGNDSETLLLAPFERRDLDDKQLQPFDTAQMVRHGLVGVEDAVASDRAAIVDGVTYFLVFGYVIIGFVLGEAWFWIAGVVGILVFVMVGLGTARRGSKDVLRWGRQTLSLLVVVIIGVVIPLTAIWFATSLADFPPGFSNALELFYGESSRDLAVSRAIQIVFISIASLLPGLMYYLFDRVRLAGLRDQFVHAIFRLDNTLVTESDLTAKYGSQIEEAYGAPDPRYGGARFTGGRRSPVIVATLLITIGWTFILLNQTVGALTNSGVVARYDMVDLLTPQVSAVAFGFLGGYFYLLRVIRRGYVRGDLKPKTYTNLTVRMILVVILAWVLETVISEPEWLILPVAFLAGIVPDTWLHALNEYIYKLVNWGSPPGDDELSEDLTLTKIEGIDIYDRSRLEDEGVNNIEALAHADLVNLMLRTRIPVPQLVDWVDQAILYLHTYHEVKPRGRLIDALRQSGIRTASELVAARALAESRGAEEKFFARFELTEKSPPTLQILLDTFEDEEWLGEITNWRSSSRTPPNDIPGATVNGDVLELQAPAVETPSRDTEDHAG